MIFPILEQFFARIPTWPKKGYSPKTITLDINGTPGPIRTCDLRIRRAGFLEFKNVVISKSWFYSTFLTAFWFRLEMFGNIWPWRAQFGHNSIEYYPLSYSSLQHNLIIYILLMDNLDDEDDVYELILKGYWIFHIETIIVTALNFFACDQQINKNFKLAMQARSPQFKVGSNLFY